MKYFLILVVLALILASFLILKPNINTSQHKPINSETPTGTYTKKVFARELGDPRSLLFTPGGNLLVSVPSTDKVLALPSKKVVIDNVDRVHGLAFYKDKLYVAGVTEVLRYNWNEEKLEATLDKKLFTLPNNNHHFRRSITFDDKGNLYVSMGSTCNVCNEDPQVGGSVFISEEEGKVRVFASGLRNSPFLKINPLTGELWGTEMGRDLLGDNLPSDEINIIKDGKNYGWPNCYGKNIHDGQFDKTPFVEQAMGTIDQVRCGTKEMPIYEIPAHNAPLGLIFIDSPKFPKDWQGDLLVALHGSWNSSTPVGYKVIHLKVEGDKIISSEDFLTGGRPVDLAFDKEGTLYISDDREGIVYKVE